MKKIALLGSTGSIGVNTLDVISSNPDKFKIVALTAHSNISLLAEQINNFNPQLVSVIDKSKISALKDKINCNCEIVAEEQGLNVVSTYKEADIVVIAISGCAGILPAIKAIEAKKNIALANKECLVSSGNIIMQKVKQNNVNILPVDSEHSAIFQCMQGRDKKFLNKIYLTCSGGSLNDVAKEDFDKFSPEHIINHPKWNMGKKISVDSATLMNKGLEIIEAKWLFDIDIEHIEVLIHKEAVIHSMVEFVDGSVIAQMSNPDMRFPISYALHYPNITSNKLEKIDFTKISKLTFNKPDLDKFPSLKLVIETGKKGGTLPAVLNAANEECVKAYLDKKIKLTKIHQILEKVLEKAKYIEDPLLEEILLVDKWAREETIQIISK